MKLCSTQSLLVGLLLIAFQSAPAAPIQEEAFPVVDTLQVERSRNVFATVNQLGLVGFTGLEWYWMPHPQWMPLRTPVGLHYGYPYQQSFDLVLVNPLENARGRVGVSLSMARWGWDASDFLFYPDEGEFAQSRQLVDVGMLYQDPPHRFSVAAGLQWFRASHDARDVAGELPAVRWWTQGRWSVARLQTLVRGGQPEWVQGGLHLQARQLEGQATEGWTTFLPDIGGSVWLENPEGARLYWNQNLYRQMVLLKLMGRLASESTRSAVLALHPDPGHLVTLDLAVSHGPGETWAGAAVEIPFFRLSYNHPDDVARFFGARGLWLAELKFDLVSLGNSRLFHSGASRPSPVETETIKQKGK